MMQVPWESSGWRRRKPETERKVRRKEEGVGETKRIIKRKSAAAEQQQQQPWSEEAQE